jgi:hypothetical protein
MSCFKSYTILITTLRSTGPYPCDTPIPSARKIPTTKRVAPNTTHATF